MIDGHTDPGGYAPIVLPSTLVKLGTAPLPAAKRVPAERLLSGAEDGQFIELEGVVRKVIPPLPEQKGSQFLLLMVDGHPCYVHAANPFERRPDDVVDARIRVRGCLSPIANLRSQAVGIKIAINDGTDMEILTPPPAEPFSAPKVTLKNLMPFSPEAELFHRRVTSGVVTFVAPGRFFYIEDENISIRVETADRSVKPGDRVDVAGFLDTSSNLAAMNEAVVRVTGHEAPPAPVPAEIGKILNPQMRSTWEQVSSTDESGRLMRLVAVLRRVVPGSDGRPATIVFEFERQLFQAFVPVDDEKAEARIASWIPESTVELTGVCELELTRGVAPSWFTISGFHLWLSSPDDLRVLNAPPWWTPRRLTIALSATGVASLIAIGLVAILRRQVIRQVGIISHELEANAVASERERMARDLHDTLEQQLTGVAMQLESLAKSPHSQSPGFMNRLALASRMLQHSRQEARRSVWDLRNRVLENHGFAAALESLAASAAIDGGPNVTTRISGSRAHLPTSITYQLLRIAQESLANALKHARAENILITLDMEAHQYLLVISDNGVGFDPNLKHPSGAPHFGLIGMRERASKIGATLDIASQPGRGTTVTVTLPIPPP